MLTFSADDRLLDGVSRLAWLLRRVPGPPEILVELRFRAGDAGISAEPWGDVGPIEIDLGLRVGAWDSRETMYLAVLRRARQGLGLASGHRGPLEPLLECLAVLEAEIRRMTRREAAACTA